jgi:hypothetical protein
MSEDILSFQIDAQAFRNHLGELDKKARNRALLKMLQTAALPMMKNMRARVRKLTGRTERDIRVRPMRFKGYVYGISVGPSAGKSGRYFIGRLLEKGFMRGHTHVPPRPWFRPGRDSSLSGFQREVEAGVRKALS